MREGGLSLGTDSFFDDTPYFIFISLSCMNGSLKGRGTIENAWSGVSDSLVIGNSTVYTPRGMGTDCGHGSFEVWP